MLLLHSFWSSRLDFSYTSVSMYGLVFRLRSLRPCKDTPEALCEACRRTSGYMCRLTASISDCWHISRRRSDMILLARSLRLHSCLFLIPSFLRHFFSNPLPLLLRQRPLREDMIDPLPRLLHDPAKVLKRECNQNEGQRHQQPYTQDILEHIFHWHLDRPISTTWKYSDWQGEEGC